MIENDLHQKQGINYQTLKEGQSFSQKIDLIVFVLLYSSKWSKNNESLTK